MSETVYRAAIITASDKGSVGAREDTSGPKVRAMLEGMGVVIEKTWIVPDEQDQIAACLCEACDELKVDLVVTTGGTGLSPRDVTPQATKSVIDYEIPAIAQAMYAEGLRHTPRAMLSRGIVGVRRFTIIINLPGSEKAVSENLGVFLPVLEHALETMRDAAQDCARVD